MEPSMTQTQVIASSPDTPVGALPPPIVPDFSLVRPIGRGGYGEVWLARSVAGAYRAVKIVYRRSFEDEKPFEREFRGLLKFEPISRLHDSQVDILHIGRNDEAGYFYYVMELADDLAGGGPIRPEIYAARTLQTELGARGRLPVQECIGVGLALATALQHLHRNGLTHRDIKPSNIVYVGGVPKLADVGLVAELAGTQSVAGTIGFAPPEGPGTVRADIYALGKVLYEAAFGRDRKEFPELPTDLRSWPEYQALLELNLVLLKACDQNPHGRYADAESLRHDLALLQRGESVARKRNRDRTKRMAARSALLVGIGALLITAAWTVRGHLQRRSITRLVHEQVATGTYLLEQQDPAGALLYFVDALRHSERDAAKVRVHRTRCAAVLAGCARLQQAFFQPALSSVALSPDERGIITASADGTALVWDVATAKVLAPALRHGGPILAVAYSPNNDLIVTAGRDGFARLWNPATAAPIHETMPHEHPVWYAAFSYDGTRLFTASGPELHSEEGGRISVWDVSTGALLASRALPGVRSIVPSHDGDRLLTGSGAGTACVWDARTLQPLIPPIRCDGPVHTARFSPAGDRIVTAGYDGSARVWNAEDGKPATGPLRHSGPVLCAVFSPDGARLLTTGHDQTVRLWSVVGGRERLLWAFKTGNGINEACWSADGRRVLLAHGDNIARLWELPSTALNSTSLLHGTTVFRAEFSPDGRRVLTCGVGDDQSGQAQLWEAAAGKPVGAPMPHQGPVIFAAFSRDGKRVVTTSPDKTARIWDAETGGPITALLHHAGPVWQAAFSPDGKQVVTASGENGPGEARVWSTESGQLLTELHHVSDVMWVDFSPDGRCVVSAGGAAGGPGHARVWDPTSGRAVASMLEHSAPVWHACFSPDGGTVATASLDQTARLWDPTSGRVLFTLRHTAPVRCIRFAPDGQRVLTASFDKTARVWDAHSGKPVGPPLSHASPVTDASFSPDGNWILTSSADGSARAWSASTGEMVTPPLLHDGAVHGAAFAPDSLRFVTAGANGEARIFRLTDEVPSAGELRTLAQSLAGRRRTDNAGLVPLTPAEARACAVSAVQLSRKQGRIP